MDQGRAVRAPLEPLALLRLRSGLAETEAPDGSGSARTCLAGIEHVADQDLDRPLRSLLRVERPAVFARPLVRTISLALGPPTSVTAVVGFSSDDDQTDSLRSALIRSLADGAARSGQAAGWDDGVVVSRLDTGASVRDAGEGVRLVYQLLAWGILGLGGLAVLVAQLMNTQQRTWFFGLARVVGATSADLALLVVLDVLVTIAASTLAAITIALAFRGRLETWSAQTFEQELVLLDAGSIPTLVAGATFVALLGAVLPAIKGSAPRPARRTGAMRPGRLRLPNDPCGHHGRNRWPFLPGTPPVMGCSYGPAMTNPAGRRSRRQPHRRVAALTLLVALTAVSACSSGGGSDGATADDATTTTEATTTTVEETTTTTEAEDEGPTLEDLEALLPTAEEFGEGYQEVDAPEGQSAVRSANVERCPEALATTETLGDSVARTIEGPGGIVLTFELALDEDPLPDDEVAAIADAIDGCEFGISGSDGTRYSVTWAAGLDGIGDQAMRGAVSLSISSDAAPEPVGVNTYFARIVVDGVAILVKASDGYDGTSRTPVDSEQMAPLAQEMVARVEGR